MSSTPEFIHPDIVALRALRILIIGGTAGGVAKVESLLCEAGFRNLVSTTDARMALTCFLQSNPDLVLLDVELAQLDGFAVMDQLNTARPPGEFLPVMVLTAETCGGCEARALAEGANDFLAEPFAPNEAILRICNLLAIRRGSAELARHKDTLEADLRRRSAEQEKTLAELHATQQHFLQSERLSALGSMISGIAHDFNNSLALILGSGEMLEKECRKNGITGDIAGYAKTIVTAAVDAAESVQRLREFHQPSPGSELRETLSLSELVRQAIEITRPRWEAESHARGVLVEVRAELADTAPISANGVEMREMLTKLILNALDAMPQGGVLTLRTCANGESVTLEVVDTGVGMTEETRRHCLEPFYTTKGDCAAGLGLAMVRGVVRRHGGTAAIASERGTGTQFSFVFPADTSRYGGTESRTRPPLQALRLLVVDDQPVLRDLLGEMLAVDGHTVELAGNGREALEHFETADFDLVITDKAMPGMNGDQLAAAIKARSPGMPVLMLTGFGDADDCIDHRSEFVDRVLTKPASIADLREAIAAVTQGLAVAG